VAFVIADEEEEKEEVAEVETLVVDGGIVGRVRCVCLE